MRIGSYRTATRRYVLKNRELRSRNSKRLSNRLTKSNPEGNTTLNRSDKAQSKAKQNTVIGTEIIAYEKVQKSAKELKKQLASFIEEAKAEKDEVKDTQNEVQKKIKDYTNAGKEFVKSYNELYDSLQEISSAFGANYTSKLKYSFLGFRDQLKALGIEVGSNGKLSLDEAIYKNVDKENIKKVFSNESGVSASVKKVTDSLLAEAEADLKRLNKSASKMNPYSNGINNYGLYGMNGMNSYYNSNSYMNMWA